MGSRSKEDPEVEKIMVAMQNGMMDRVWEVLSSSSGKDRLSLKVHPGQAVQTQADRHGHEKIEEIELEIEL